MEKVPLELADLLQELGAHGRILAEAKGIELTVAGGPPTEVFADPLRLRQLFLNLLDNAVKYTAPEGKIFLSHGQTDDGWVRVTVKDTGVGIPPEDLGRIFERFYRVDKHRSRAQGGSGLGLAICRWIAQVHGGRIEVRSTPGKGSAFMVYLPLRAGARERAREPRQAPSRPARTRGFQATSNPVPYRGRS
ncbi:MAG: hypothetical protein HY900_11670 [Deltaproteobacteria bacterium]|nr:hypothetical protein [Deltaproteobacteria bacterium]